MANQSLSQTTPNGNGNTVADVMTAAFKSAFVPPPKDNPAELARWLTAKIEHYEAEVTALESELKTARILLKAHQTWLAEVERKEGER